jgi:hypothetical protein
MLTWKSISQSQRILILDYRLRLVVFKSRQGGITTATIKARSCFCLFGLLPKIQATRYAGDR